MAVSRFVLSIWLASAVAGSAAAGGHVTSATGVLEVRRGAGEAWVPLGPLEVFSAGDRLRTGFGAAARLTLDDGSLLELGPDALLSLSEEPAGAVLLGLELGRLKARVTRRSVGRFELRTPTAKCRVRGTEFEVRVVPGGRTWIELHEGLLAVEDNLGNQTLLKPNERIQVDVRGLEAPERRPSPAQVASASLRSAALAEWSAELAQDQARGAVAREARLAELQSGRALMDVGGNRVRVEEYVLRPRADRFKLVVLNARDRRLDYFYYQGTFNRALPADLSMVLAQLPGCVDRACDWHLTEFSAARSNGPDLVLERGVNSLGGQIDVNGNGESSDNVTALFDSGRNAFVDVSGRSVYRTLFNRYGFYVNGRLKHGWSADNVTSYVEARASPASTTDPFTGGALTNATAWLDPLTGTLATRTVNVTYPSADRTHQRVYESYSDGSFLQWDNYAVAEQGGAVSRAEFGDPTRASSFQRGVLDYHYEQVVTSSHFGGRKIDLVVEPKFLVQAGLLEAGLSGN